MKHMKELPDKALQELFKEPIVHIEDRLECVFATNVAHSHGVVFWGNKVAVGVSKDIALHECSKWIQQPKTKFHRHFEKKVRGASSWKRNKKEKNSTEEPMQWTAHNDLVRCLVVWKKWNKLVSGSWDKTVKMWNDNMTCERVFEGHTSYVLCVIIWEKYDLLCSSCYHGMVRIWQYDGTCVASSQRTNVSPIYSIGIFQDYLCGGARNNQLLFWDHKGNEVDSVIEDTKDVKGMQEFGGKLICNTSLNQGMMIFKPNSKQGSNHIIEKEKTYPSVIGEGLTVIQLGQAKPILVASHRHSISFWDETLTPLGTTPSTYFDSSVRTLDWNPSRRWLAVGCNESWYIFKGRIK